jgi:hypothetical protein
VLDPKRGLRQLGERIDQREESYAYRNRRAQMYGELREMLDPARPQERGGPLGFAIPPPTYGSQYAELRRQLAPIPLMYDGEGRMELPPKNKRAEAGESISGPGQSRTKRKTLSELIGCSPDEADALVLAVHGMLHKVIRPVASAF